MALERLQEAEVVLQPWLSGRTTPRELTLFKADLQRCDSKPGAASKIRFGCIRMIRRFYNCLCF